MSLDVYKKTFSRDHSLGLVQIWYAGESTDPRQYTAKQQPHLPYLAFWRHDNTVECYVNQKGLNWIYGVLRQKLKEDPNYYRLVIKEFHKRVKSIEPIFESPKALGLRKFEKFTRELRQSWPWFEAFWWLMHMLEEDTKSPAFKAVNKMRHLTDRLGPGSDVVIRKSIERAHPHIKEFASVVLLEEALSGSLPKRRILEQRMKGYCYTYNTLYLKPKSFIEKKYNIHIKEELAPKGLRVLRGQVAYPGKVTGRVVKVYNTKDIPKVKVGDVLVSPMTMPEMLPAMKKASGFVTDEGGLICHAAILARELKKTCIVGTKIATGLFKDGDTVEVDAHLGLVKKVK